MTRSSSTPPLSPLSSLASPKEKRSPLASGELVCSRPQLLRYELANVTLVKARRHPERRHLLETAFVYFLQSRIEYVEVDFVETLSLARQRALTAYDSAYVWLAR